MEERHQDDHHYDEESLALIRRAAGSQSLSKLKDVIMKHVVQASSSSSSPSSSSSLSLSSTVGKILSTAGHEDGKTALIMAAWKGCLDNVKFLVEDCRVDVDVYSKAKYAYGKTPLFFALTQSRTDVVKYLLIMMDDDDDDDDGDGDGDDPNPASNQPLTRRNRGRRRPPKVRIVNNKGQSILSLAASHDMPLDVLDRIRALEQQEEEQDQNEDSATGGTAGTGWWNFRASHSDGLEYGDLDPRFLSRPLRDNDVVTELAINPTTSKTRKNGFAKRNPDVVANEREGKKQQQKQRQEIKRKKIEQEQQLQLQHEKEWEQHWEAFLAQTNKDRHDDDVSIQNISAIIIRIIRVGLQLRRSWLEEVVDRFNSMDDDDTNDNDKDAITKSILDAASNQIRENPNNDDTEKMLVIISKLKIRLFSTEDQDPSRNNKSCNSRKRNNKKAKIKQKRQHPHHQITNDPLDMELWKEAFQNVEMLSLKQPMSILETNNSKDVLCLPAPSSPGSTSAFAFVDTVEDVGKVTLELRMNLSLSISLYQRRFLVAIDSEWYDGQNADNLSTLQLSFCDVETGDDIRTYIVDLLVYDESYQKETVELIHMLTSSEDLIVLGFAIGHDISMMRNFVRNRSEDMTATCRSSIILDLQRFFAAFVLDDQKNGTEKSPPGLKKCASHFSAVPLSKTEQCSDWSMRPLRQNQLEYAALDSFILLPLLACGYRQVVDC